MVLAAGILALSVDVFNSAYIMFGYYRDFPHFTGITYAFPFLYGPVFYLYAKLISSDTDNFKPSYLLHFIPFILVVIYGMVFVYFKSSDFKIALINNKIGSLLPHLQVISLLKPVHGIIYVYLTIKVVSVYNKQIRNSYANIEKINLDWLRHLTIGLVFVWGVVVLTYVVNAVTTKELKLDFLIYEAASVLIYSIGYFSLRQPQIFERPLRSKEQKPLIDEKPATGESSTYQKSGLSDQEAQNYLARLIPIMEKEKLYLESELTLRDLAEKLSVSTHNLSEILNTRLNVNFYDFINRYRVEEVKNRLADNESENYNLLAIAFDSGFNSKTSFNTIFKKLTGMTPSQYRKHISETAVH